MADVFISYHEASAGELAQQIADTLEAADISCWVARRDMPPGGDFAREIPPQIDACKLFLLLLNEQACQSNHVESEIALAFRRLNRRKDIIILPIETEEFLSSSWIDYYLIQIQSIKLHEPNAEHIRELTQKIIRLLGVNPPKLPEREDIPAEIETVPQMPPFSGEFDLTQALLLPSSEPLPPPQPKVIGNGECGAWGSNVTYTLDDTGQLLISGVGPMLDYRKEMDEPWYFQQRKIYSVVIESGVTAIGAHAFSGCSSLINVSISNSVKSIGYGAFWGCRNLVSINIPDSVRFMGYYVFFNCEKLASVGIPDSIKFIGYGTFLNCQSLKSVSVSQNTRISPWAFDLHTILTPHA